MGWWEDVKKRAAQRRAREQAARDEADARGRSATSIAWLCASTDPRRDRYANEMAVRKLHAVPCNGGDTLDDLKYSKSVCGRRAKHGWCIDLFNNKCKVCLSKVEGE